MLDFIVVGSQKSGTTAIRKNLSKVKDVYLPKDELHFFDNDNLFKTNKLDYSEINKHFDFNCGNINGEVTPIYIYWDNCLERIYEYNSNVKIVVILRNPIHRAYSQWNMESERGTDRLNFYESLKVEKIFKKNKLQHRVYSYVERGMYYKQIKKIFKIFPKENVLILKYETYKQNNVKTINKILRFIGSKEEIKDE